MTFSNALATATADIFRHLGQDVKVDGIKVRGIFDFEEVSTPAGFRRAPVLIVSQVDAETIDKGADFFYEGIDYVISSRYPSDNGMIALELDRA